MPPPGSVLPNFALSAKEIPHVDVLGVGNGLVLLDDDAVVGRHLAVVFLAADLHAEVDHFLPATTVSGRNDYKP